MKISITVEPDDFTAKVAQAFDLEFDGTITTEIPDFEPPETGSYNIGMIVGSSGSGKSQILRNHFSEEVSKSEKPHTWNPQKAIVSHFNTPETAIEKLFACGVASVPTLCKPHHVLSNGEKYRAMIVLSSCHKDIIEWIEPDWVFDCDSGQRFENTDPRTSMRRVAKIEIY